MDDIFLPDESEDDSFEGAPFQRSEISPRAEAGSPPEKTSALQASDHVKITFDRFVTLVANHSFVDVVERNKDEEVILSTNLLTDLANARRFTPNAKGPILLIAGIVIGILFAYFLF
jgi:hypothetical protein